MRARYVSTRAQDLARAVLVMLKIIAATLAALIFMEFVGR